MNYGWEGSPGYCSVVYLEEQEEDLESSLDLCGKLDSIGDLVGTQLKESLIVEHGRVVFQIIRVHKSDPLDKSDVVLLDLRLKES